jgi:hypothetical protein
MQTLNADILASRSAAQPRALVLDHRLADEPTIRARVMRVVGSGPTAEQARAPGDRSRARQISARRAPVRRPRVLSEAENWSCPDG